MYEYLDKDPEKGDVVEFIHDWKYWNRPLGILAIVQEVVRNEVTLTKVHDNHDPRFSMDYLKIVKTKPAKGVKVGDTVICVKKPINRDDIINIDDTGDVIKVYDDGAFNIDTDDEYWQEPTDFVVLCKSEVKPQDNLKELKHAIDLMRPKFCNENAEETCGHYAETKECDGCNAFNPQQKGNKMKADIKIEVNGEKIELCKHEAAACMKPKTDLAKAMELPVAMIVFGLEGKREEVRGYKNRKDAKKAKSKFLKHHKNLGKTVQLNESYATFTTSIPIVEVK